MPIFPGVTVAVAHFTENHTFLTSQNNVGSTKVTFKSFNSATYATTVADYYMITTKWVYRATITDSIIFNLPSFSFCRFQWRSS